jgi:hypothetical protein
MCENKYLLRVGRGLPQSGLVQFLVTASALRAAYSSFLFSLGVKKMEGKR